MIRRRMENQFWLITQHDHALLAGTLARAYGNEDYARPDPLEPTLAGIGLHDCGWPLHDDLPTLNADGLPIDVFESTWEISLPVWRASADGAQRAGAYAGLLVSLHVLGLSAYAAAMKAGRLRAAAPRGPQPTALQEKFALNKFQHGEIERQERLRKVLGLRIDLPRRFGLAEEGVDRREDGLIHNFHLLQAMDKLSLAICCTTIPSNPIEPVRRVPGGPEERWSLRRVGDNLLLWPWPFGVDGVGVEVPFRRLPARRYGDLEEFRRIYAGAAVERLRVEVRADG